MVLHTGIDAYTDRLKIFGQFDFILDDGPHTLLSMLRLIKLYDGILIIEVQVRSFETSSAGRSREV